MAEVYLRCTLRRARRTIIEPRAIRAGAVYNSAMQRHIAPGVFLVCAALSGCGSNHMVPAAASAPGVATPGVATPGVATPGVATPGVATPDAATRALTGALRDRVATIVVIYAENRAFDNLYGRFPGAAGLDEVLGKDGKPLPVYQPQRDRDRDG